MWGKIVGVIILIIIAVGLFVPVGSITNTVSNDNNTSDVAVTYGETTYNNGNYKNTVDQYFQDNGNLDLNHVKQTVITADDVNKISGDISHKTYNSNQVLSCAMVDLNTNDDIQVDVDKSKITTVTESMYKSALNSSGITKGHVIVTSPTTATGESALAGVMKSYETATGKEIPSDLKDAANNEIYTESQVVNNTNASADDVANLVSQAKEQASQQNTTDNQTITNIVNNVASNNNINLSNNDVNLIVQSVSQSQSVKDQATDYQSQISDYVDTNGSQTLFQQLWNMLQSLINNNGSSSNTNYSN
ncbi:DUF1002 domain-containing protein [uncultured Methanosphaera sp.]|uniref:DUF1002 domain-containing protein n=1 Tax=uncultured Methanosphaera sp. TaxID=262501 RepID=UPI000DC4293E|nr:DUF1002 domain-containing protein [uncultured Methanosphaera sp.]RAP43816.1 MAG: hypothetical protein BZ134_05560 [Methanosphaera sp. SHI1033]